MRGEYKVEAKSEMQRESAERQVQGECRKTSADKEPTTHLNTLGGSDHVRIWATASPADLSFRFICYCVCVCWG